LYTHADFINLNSEIRLFDWEGFLLSSENIDEISIKFTNKFIEFVKMYIPVKIITIRPNDKPWFNSSIRRAIRIRDRLHKQVKQNSSPFLLRKYKTQRNKVNNMIKYAREQLFINANDMLDKNGKSNPKSYWKLVKILMGNCNHSPNIPPLQKLDSGEYVINNEDKANILNNFFCSITEIENSNVLTPDFHDRTGNRIDSLHITSDETKDILECLQLGKAVGSDLISHCILKNTASTIC
jgi:hypothetical protein